MKRIVILAALAACCALIPNDLASGHSGSGAGGKTRPPGDWVPPNLGEPQNSGGPSAPGRPTTGDPSGPTIPGPSTGRGPASPRRGSGTGGMGRRRTAASRGLDRWEYWWAYNREAFLDLKNRSGSPRTISGSSGFLVGRGRKDMALSPWKPSADTIKAEIFPSLEAALAQDDSKIVNSALVAISRITRPDDAHLIIDKITALLASRHETVREVASISLGILGSSDACETCTALMYDTAAGRKLLGEKEVPRRIRAFAALSLGLIGAEESARRLRLVVEKGNAKTQKDLISCAITALGLLKDETCRDENVRFLIRKLDDERMDPVLRAYIPVALGKLGHPMALEHLVALFRRNKLNNWVRQSCAVAIGRLASMEDENAVKLLLHYTEEGKDSLARHLSFIALGQIGARDGRFAANQKLHGTIAGFFLSRIARPNRPSHRSWAAIAGAIHAMKHPALQPPLIAAVREMFLETKNPSQKGALALSLGLLNAAGAAPDLYDELRATRDQSLQGYICVSLGMICWTRAAETIRGFTADESLFSLRIQAATALGLMADAEAVEALIALVENSSSLNVTSSAAKALGLIGDRRAIPPLRKILEDPKAKSLARDYAAVALGMIGEKTSLPWNTPLSENCNYSIALPAIAEAINIL